jgi:hypothetical protein
MADATTAAPSTDPDRASFTIAWHAARDQLIQAAGILASTVIDLTGTIGRPARRWVPEPGVPADRSIAGQP